MFLQPKIPSNTFTFIEIPITTPEITNDLSSFCEIMKFYR